MHITLEQARAFDCVARHGTIQNAANELNKGHSAIVYLLRTLEEQTGLVLFDRSGYRNRVTLQGEIVLRYCRNILATEQELEIMCKNLRGGWEPSLKIIYDGIIDFNVIGDALFMLNGMKAPTEVKVLAAHLNEVKARFEDEKGDLMMTILPINQPGLNECKMRPIRLLLVASSQHPLGEKGRKKVTPNDLNLHTYIKIRETAGLVGLSTENLNFDSSFFVNDFFTKKLAILKRLGFGWLPDYLIKSELKEGQLVVVKGVFASEQKVNPRLYYRSEALLGKATKEVLKFLGNDKYADKP